MRAISSILNFVMMQNRVKVEERVLYAHQLYPPAEPLLLPATRKALTYIVTYSNIVYAMCDNVCETLRHYYDVSIAEPLLPPATRKAA